MTLLHRCLTVTIRINGKKYNLVLGIGCLILSVRRAKLGGTRYAKGEGV